MTNPAAEAEFHGRVEKLETLLRDLEACADPVVRGKAIEAVQTLMEFHGTGLSRLIELVASAGDAGKTILASMANDDLVASLLLLYGLHPADFEARVRQAIDKAGPAVRQLGGSAELLGVDNGAVRIRANWNGHGCHSSPGKIKAALESAIYEKAPEAAAIQIEGLAPPSGSTGFVPLEQLLGHSGRPKTNAGVNHEPQASPA